MNKILSKLLEMYLTSSEVRKAFLDRERLAREPVPWLWYKLCEEMAELQQVMMKIFIEDSNFNIDDERIMLELSDVMNVLLLLVINGMSVDKLLNTMDMKQERHLMWYTKIDPEYGCYENDTSEDIAETRCIICGQAIYNGDEYCQACKGEGNE